MTTGFVNQYGISIITIKYASFHLGIHRETSISGLFGRSGEGNVFIASGLISQVNSSGAHLIKKWNKDWQQRLYDITNSGEAFRYQPFPYPY